MKSGFLTLLIGLIFVATAQASDFDPKRIYQKTSKMVVLITAFDHGKKYRTMGSGSIIREDGLILTNSHVIFNNDRSKPYGELRVFLKPTELREI